MNIIIKISYFLFSRRCAFIYNPSLYALDYYHSQNNNEHSLIKCKLCQITEWDNRNAKIIKYYSQYSP